MSSPPSGRSTLTTSAPRSPSSIAASGPASTREKSATRIPSSGGIGWPHLVHGADARRLRPAPRPGRGRTCCAGPTLRAPLLEALARRDRLVILGDGLELREAAHARRRRASPRRFFAEVGARARPRRRARDRSPATTTTGSWPAGSTGGCRPSRRASSGSSSASSPPRRARSPRRSPSRARPARVRFAYPGVWLREDVYAIHGHYADLHATVPTFERLAAGAMARWVVRLPEDGATPGRLRGGARADLRLDARAHAALRPRGDSAGAGASARAWVALAGERPAAPPGARRRARRGLRGRGRALNAAGLGPLDRSLSGAALRRGDLHGIREVLRAARHRRART